MTRLFSFAAPVVLAAVLFSTQAAAPEAAAKPMMSVTTEAMLCTGCDEVFSHTYGQWVHALGEAGMMTARCGGPYQYPCHWEYAFETCRAHHEWCQWALAEPLEALIANVSITSGAQLKEMLAASPETIRYNEQRSAIQIVGCDGSVVAHLPLSSEQLSALAD